MNLGPLSIGQPWLLAALSVCVVILLATVGSRILASVPMRIAITLTRLLAAALLIFAIADTRWMLRSRQLAVATIVDDATTISAPERADVRRSLATLRRNRSETRWVDVPAARSRRGGGIGGQLSMALATMPTDRVRRILIATDGRSPADEVLAAVDRARRAGVTVSVLPMGDRPPIDQVAVQAIEGPRLVRAGQPGSVGIRLFASSRRAVRLELFRDGVPVRQIDVQAAQGSSTHDMQVDFPDEGLHELEVRATPDQDSNPTNNHARAYIRVVSPPRVLLVNEQPGNWPALAQVFRDSRLRVDAVTVGQVPDHVNAFERYQLVVIDEVMLTNFSESQQRAIRAWVEERGGGLITTTGTYAVRREPEPLRDMEPIRPPRAIPEPRPLELILVIDRSGSMQGAPMNNARRAGVAAVRALRVDARVGGVAFSGSADAVLAPVPMSLSQHMISFVSGLQAGGGTDIGSALQAARGLITNDPRYIHHVILMSDGESAAGPALSAAQGIVQAGASITAITLGPRNQLMADIARIGRGRYHVTNSPTSLPALFVREAQYHVPPPSREVRFRPAIVRRPTWLDGVNPAADPQMLGYVLSDLRPGADLVLAAPDGSPILAHWFFGLGQVASFASGTSGRWANEWRLGYGFRRMWSQMAWDMLRRRNEDMLEVHIDPDRRRPGLQRISVVAQHVRAEPVPIATIWGSASLNAPLPLRPRAPGVWEAAVALPGSFLVDARLPSTPEPSVAAAVDHTYPAELAAFGADPTALAAIAEAGGGRVLRDAADVLNNVVPVRAARDLRTPFILAALILYLLGVLLLRMPTGFVGGATEESVARRRSRLSNAPPSSAPGAPSDTSEKKAA